MSRARSAEVTTRATAPSESRQPSNRPNGYTRQRGHTAAQWGKQLLVETHHPPRCRELARSRRVQPQELGDDADAVGGLEAGIVNDNQTGPSGQVHDSRAGVAGEGPPADPSN